MSDVKTKMARSTQKKHEDAVRSLQVQMTTSVICIIPPSLIVFVVLFEFEKSQLFAEMSIAWYGAHTLSNMLGMYIFFPPYTKFFKKVLKK